MIKSFLLFIRLFPLGAVAIDHVRPSQNISCNRASESNICQDILKKMIVKEIKVSSSPSFTIYTMASRCHSSCQLSLFYEFYVI